MAKKKKIITTKKDNNKDLKEGTANSSKKKLVATRSKVSKNLTGSNTSSRQLVFGKENYKWVGIGFALILLGMLLMIGGFNEDPSIWDESKIYGFRRTLLAPIVILAGLGVEIYAIFK